jgi:hypothetical protein
MIQNWMGGKVTEGRVGGEIRVVWCKHRYSVQIVSIQIYFEQWTDGKLREMCTLYGILVMWIKNRHSVDIGHI